MKIKTNEHNGAKYEIVESEKEIEATVCFGDKRIVLQGLLSIEKMSNSYKFGKQIQFVVYGKNIKVESRAINKGFNRIEIAIPFELGEEMIKEFVKQFIEIKND